MSALIDQLKHDHQAIVETLNKVKELGIGNANALKLLRAAKASLLEHLRKEDTQLYPPLRNRANSDQDLKWTLDTFAKDMEGISKAALAFFDKYANGGSGMDFLKDFGSLVAVLGARIRREESVIYKKYDEFAA